MRTTIHRSFRRERAARLGRASVRERMQAIRLRLRRVARSLGQRVPGRVSPLERVMRRAAAVHLGRSFNAQVRMQLLLSAGRVSHIERLDSQPTRVAHVPVHTVTQQTRTLLAQQVRHERLVERLARRESPDGARAPRAAFARRVEQRHATPRIPLTAVRQQPAVSVAMTGSAEATAGASASVRAEVQRAATASMRADAKQPRFAAPAAAPLALPAQELSRLTDHVIRQLDRRVLSWQERTGRV